MGRRREEERSVVAVEDQRGEVGPRAQEVEKIGERIQTWFQPVRPRQEGSGETVFERRKFLRRARESRRLREPGRRRNLRHRRVHFQGLRCGEEGSLQRPPPLQRSDPENEVAADPKRSAPQRRCLQVQHENRRGSVANVRRQTVVGETGNGQRGEAEAREEISVLQGSRGA